MSHSLQMQESVDKQIEYEIAFGHLVRRSLLFCLIEADNNLSRLLSGRVGEDIRDV